MPSLPVERLPAADNGRLLVRLNNKYREGIARYGIAKITNTGNGNTKTVLVLGHDDHSSIFMPYDIRTALGVRKGCVLKFSIHEVGLWAKLCWYVGSPDPAVHIPARIAIGGIVLAVVGLIIAVVSVVCP